MAVPGVIIIVSLLALILSKKVSALSALILVPVIVSLAAGFGLETFNFAVTGIRNIAPVAAMFIFAILFFGVLTDTGLFDPIINGILKLVGNHPARIVVGAAVLSMLVHLDGSGAVTFLITIPAMLPLFEKLNMDRRILAAVVALGAGTMNMVPRGGPTIRAATSLGFEVTELYRSVMIPQLAGLLFVILVATYLGRKEAKRLGTNAGRSASDIPTRELTRQEKALRRPRLFWFNLLLTLTTIVVLISGVIPPVIAFMAGTVVVLMINYPRLEEQRERIDAHARASILMASILLAAGIFTGILQESGMIADMAAVTGDDVLGIILRGEYRPMEDEPDLEGIRERIISANAYLGAGPVVEALSEGAGVVITGRMADPALFMAPAIHEFGWSFSDFDRLGKGTILGHLLECAGQITGGYFADPGYQEVPGIARLGFPLAEVREDGSYVITKVPDAGGMVTLATCKEQLLYEVGDPSTYISPDVVADFSGVTLDQAGKDRVEVRGSTGRRNTGLYKVSVGYRDSYMGEGQISYGGPGAVRRARLALEILKQRFQDMGLRYADVKYDLIGFNSLYGERVAEPEPYEVRVRVAARTDTLKEAIRVGNEVETLYTNGPSGGGGVSKSAREIIAIRSVLIEADLVKPIIQIMEV